MKYKNLLKSHKTKFEIILHKTKSLIRSIPTNKEAKLVISFLILLIMLSAPTIFAKAPSSEKIAQAESTILKPLPSLEITKTPENTLEPIKTQQAESVATTQPKKVGAKPSDKAAENSATSTVKPPESIHTESAPAKTATEAPQATGILGYINQARAESGLAQLSYNSQLNAAAKSKSQDMLDRDYFAHTNPDGKTDFDFIRDAGYTFNFAGSNIAKGSFTEKTVFDAWMNSSGHRANILDPRAREFGYGVAGNYFTMMVGAR